MERKVIGRERAGLEILKNRTGLLFNAEDRMNWNRRAELLNELIISGNDTDIT